jgi:hypothetical protein
VVSKAEGGQKAGNPCCGFRGSTVLTMVQGDS